MQITSLSNANTLNVGRQSGQAGETGDFANLLLGQMQREQSTGQKQVKEDGSLSNEKLAELTQYLQLEDITEIENGTEIFQQMLSNVEMDKISFIKQHLNLSDQDLLSSLLSFLAGLNPEQTEKESLQKGLGGLIEGLSSLNQQLSASLGVNNTSFIQTQFQQTETEQKLVSSLYSFLQGNNFVQGKEGNSLEKHKALIEDAAPFKQQFDLDLFKSLYSLLSNSNLQQMEEEGGLKSSAGLSEVDSNGNVKAAIEALMELLPKMDMKQASFMLNQNAADAIKSLKLFQLLSKYETPEGEQKAFTTLLEKVEVTLNGLLKEDNKANRKELLHQIFTPVLKEAKQGAVSFKQTHLPLLSPVFPSEEHISENLSVKSLDSNNSLSLPFQQMAKSEQLVLMMEKSGQPVSSERLIAQFEKILATSQIMKTGNTQRMFIKLNPDHLGMLKVELIQKDTGMIAKITAATSAAKEILESQLQSLKTAFGSQNIQLDKIEITLQTNEQERFLSKDSHQENKEQEQEQEQQENKEQKQQLPEGFSAAFAEALISTEA